MVTGLPVRIRACLFDLDGVLTRTAEVHRAAWTELFDRFLSCRAELDDVDRRPFTPEDYQRFVDGRIRNDGVRTFLASRHVSLPEGTPADAPGVETVWGLGNAKNTIFLDRIERDGVAVHADGARALQLLHDAGMPCAVVSASANTAQVLESTGLGSWVDVRVDGVVAAQRHLRGKPAPDTFLAAATQLGVPPEDAAVFEDAIAGVEAGRAGGFGFVVGVDRVGEAHRHALEAAGADIVVADLTTLVPG